MLARLLVVLGKPFEKARAPIEFAEGWSIIEEGITTLKRVIQGDPSTKLDSQCYMKIYSTSYNMTQDSPSDVRYRLYASYCSVLQSYCTSTIVTSLMSKSDMCFLQDFVHKWADYKIMIRFLSHFSAHLHTVYDGCRRVPGLKEVGVTHFCELVCKRLKVRDIVIHFIGKERHGEQIDRALLKDVLDVFIEMGTEFYELEFEHSLIEDTANYYQREASNWVVEESCPAYRANIDEYLRREKERVSHYLHSDTIVKLINRVEQMLWMVFENQVLEEEHPSVSVLLREDKVDDILRLYRCLCKSPFRFGSMFKEHVMAEGMLLVDQAEEDAELCCAYEQVFVEKLIQMHDKYFGYVDGCFENNPVFQNALREVFEVLCNINIGGSSIAEVLTIYCDNILKDGSSEKLSDELIEENLDKLVTLLPYLSDKVHFAELLRNKLARRLLSDWTAGTEHERCFLAKLKKQHGAGFTSQMENMLRDYILARETQTKFRAYLNDFPQRDPKIDLSVSVLSAGFWPSYRSSDLNVPAEMVRCVETFNEFYGMTSSKNLRWMYSLGSCNISANFENKTVELITTTYQASVLLLFNDSDKLSFSEIRDQLNLTNRDVKIVLHSLSCAKYNILKKQPDTEAISPFDVFEFNYKFTDKMQRIRIPLLPVGEKKKVTEDVSRVRLFTIDAAILRIMKQRYALSHQELVMECVEQLSRMFKPDIKVIEKRIEKLITRHFLRTTATSSDVYKYMY